jgi:hypothetical protein
LRTVTFLFSLLLSLPAIAQQSNSTSGQCSPIAPNNSGSVTINCSGLSREQGADLLRIVNRILANQIDLKVFSGKLDEILLTLRKLPTSRDFDVQQFEQRLRDYQGPPVAATIDADTLSPFVMKVARVFHVEGPNLLNNGTYRDSLTVQFGDGSERAAEVVQAAFASFGITATIESLPALGANRIRIRIASQM